jgi:predicted transcriptional regulator of viral defense system
MVGGFLSDATSLRTPAVYGGEYVRDLELVRLMENKESAVFTAQQMAVLLKETPEAAAVRLNRLVAKKVLQRVMRGRYALPSADILSIASGIYPPSYISLLAAFEYHGTTTQMPRVIDVINPNHSGTFPLATGNVEIRFIKVAPSLMYGYRKVYPQGKAAIIAEKERAVVDGLLYPRYVPFDETIACIRSGIDKNKCLDFARRTKRQVVMKRMGYLLLANGYDCAPDDLGTLSETYVPLDPAMPLTGRYNKKWHVLINRVIE